MENFSVSLLDYLFLVSKRTVLFHFYVSLLDSSFLLSKRITLFVIQWITICSAQLYFISNCWPHPQLLFSNKVKSFINFSNLIYLFSSLTRRYSAYPSWSIRQDNQYCYHIIKPSQLLSTNTYPSPSWPHATNHTNSLPLSIKPWQ